MKKFAIVLLLTCLSGCSTVLTRPAKNSEIEHVQPLIQPVGQNSVVVVTRDVGLAGSPYDARLIVDNKRMADLRPSQQVRIDVTPGVHSIAVYQSDNRERPGVQIEVAAGQVQSYRVATTATGFALIPSDAP